MRGSLGRLEARVMDLLWDRPEPATVRDVWQRVGAEQALAYTTVMTVLDNLHRKKWLHRDRVGRAYRYWPVASRDEHVAELMREALASSVDRTGVLARFAEQLDEPESLALHEAMRRRQGSAP